MGNKTKTFWGIGLVVLCLFAATLFITSCSNTETENSQVVPQSTQDTTIPNNNATEKPIENTAPSTTPNTTQENLLSKDAAKKIAFDHAKVKEADAKRLKIDLDYEDGIQVYEIDFVASGFEYDYDINAKTGEIMKFDKEKD